MPVILFLVNCCTLNRDKLSDLLMLSNECVLNQLRTYVVETSFSCSTGLDPWNSHFSLRKHAYSKILKILPPKMAIFQIKNPDIFHISAQNIDCGYSLESPRRGGSNEYQQSMFLSRNNKNNVYPYQPQFYFIKVGFKGVKII